MTDPPKQSARRQRGADDGNALHTASHSTSARGFQARILSPVFDIIGMMERKIVARGFLSDRLAEVPELESDLLAGIVRLALAERRSGKTIYQVIAALPPEAKLALQIPIHEHRLDSLTQVEIDLWQSCIDMIREGGATDGR